MKIGPDSLNDGLVFGYDTGEFPSDSLAFDTFKPFSGNNRFYKGRSARNYIANQNAVRKFPLEAAAYSSAGTFATKHPNDIKAYDINGNRLQTYVNTGVTDWTNTHHAHWQHDPILNKPVVVMEDLVSGQWKAKSWGTGLGSWNSLGLTHGDKYTISWLQWVDNLSKNAKTGLYTKNTSGSSGFHDGQANSPSSYNTKLRTWQRVYQTYTTNNNRDLSQTLASIYMYGHYNVRATVKVADVQIDLHDHPTTYQEYNGSTTERSSTQGLLDLKGNTTINTSTVSFDSNGFPTFDGTDDYIYPNNITNGSGLTSITAEFVVKASANNKNIIKSNSNALLLHYGGAGFYLNATDSQTSGYLGWNGKLTGGTGVYEHLVATWDGTTMKLYVNGESTGTTRAYSAGSTGILRDLNGVVIGGSFNSTQPYFNGDIPIAKIYSNALSDSEVKQNFDAYKNRFEL